MAAGRVTSDMTPRNLMASFDRVAEAAAPAAEPAVVPMTPENQMITVDVVLPPAAPARRTRARGASRMTALQRVARNLAAEFDRECLQTE